MTHPLLLKKIFLVLFLFLALLPWARAGEGERKGFLVGFGPRAGYVSNIQRGFGGFELRVGGGFNERFLLFYESGSDFTRKQGNDIYAYDTQAKGQYFFWKDLYTNLGVGFTVGRIENSVVSYTSKVGFVTSVGLGYEFRLTRRFFMAPELSYSYRRIERQNFHSPGANLHLGWYF